MKVRLVGGPKAGQEIATYEWAQEIVFPMIEGKDVLLATGKDLSHPIKVAVYKRIDYRHFIMNGYR